MNYKIVRSSSLLSKYGEETISDRLSGFEPALDSSGESFLVTRSIMMEKKDKCRTYIAYDAETSDIMGFFSLGFRCLDIPDDCGLSNTMLKKLNRSDEGVPRHISSVNCREQRGTKVSARRSSTKHCSGSRPLKISSDVEWFV